MYILFFLGLLLVTILKAEGNEGLNNYCNQAMTKNSDKGICI